MTLPVVALVLAPVFFFVWLRWRLGIARELRAWKPCLGYVELKLCPRCGTTALSSETDCTGCGHSPDDDITWREESTAYLRRRHEMYRRLDEE